MARDWWLVQRLLDPPKKKLEGKLGLLGPNPFSFGGGLLNGGFSKDAMQLLTPFMEFDYMGAAEYEFGDVPKAFGKLFGTADLNFWSTSITDKGKKDTGKTVMVVGSASTRAEIDANLQAIVDGKLELRDTTAFRDALGLCVCWTPRTKKFDHWKWCPHHPKYGERHRRGTTGWIELGTGTFWTVSKDMFDGMISLVQKAVAQ